MEDLALRREWRKRIEDHDGHAQGDGSNEGGIERWLVLAEGVGLDRAYVVSGAGILPATRFAVEAYVRFVRERSLLEAIARSEEHTSELQSLMRISYAVFCLKKKTQT